MATTGCCGSVAEVAHTHVPHTHVEHARGTGSVPAMAQKFADIEDYVASLTPESAAAVQQVRGWAHEEIAGLTETIRYNLPTFQRDGRSVLHVAGWTEHLSLYPEPPAPPDDAGLVLDLSPHASGRSTLRFDLDRPLPEGLLRRLLRAYRG